MASEGSFTGTEVFIPIPAESSASLVDWVCSRSRTRSSARAIAKMPTGVGQTVARAVLSARRYAFGWKWGSKLCGTSPGRRCRPELNKARSWSRSTEPTWALNRVQVLWFLRLLADMPEEGWRALLDATQELARSREAEIRGANAAASEARHVLGPRCDDLIDRGPNTLRGGPRRSGELSTGCRVRCVCDARG